jgi:signal recognition particle receptor subunit beta
LYTVPGQVLYERTRVAVLNGADGVVFVADSQRNKLAENVRSLQELARNLTQQGKRFMEFPMVMQYNKRDTPDALPLEILERYLNSMKVPSYESIASKGVGVFDTLRTISKMVISKL